MAFTVNMHWRDCVGSHASALQLHTKAEAKPWRNGGDDYPLPNKRVRHMGVRKLPDGSIAFRFHRTDVVTWHPDETYTLVPYQSQSTCDFANTFLPSWHQLCRTGTLLTIGGWRNGTMHPVDYDSTVRINPATNAPTHPLKSVFRKRKVDRKKAKALLAETNYAEYREWRKLMVAMSGTGTSCWDVTAHNLKEYLADRDKWYDLMRSYYGNPGTIREFIYKTTFGDRSPHHYEYADTLPANTRVSSDTAGSGWHIAPREN